MANSKISELTSAGALTGAEEVEVIRPGTNLRTTTQDIADLGSGGTGTVETIVAGSNITVDATDPANPIVSATGGAGAVDSVNGATGVVVLDAGDIGNTPAGTIAATNVQAAINELDAEKASASLTNITGKYIIDQATPSTAGGTITLDCNSQIQRSFVGSATFAAAKIIALSNTTNTLFFNFIFEVTNVAAELTVPSDWLMADTNFDGTEWTPSLIGKYELGGAFDDVNNVWYVKIQGPFF